MCLKFSFRDSEFLGKEIKLIIHLKLNIYSFQRLFPLKNIQVHSFINIYLYKKLIKKSDRRFFIKKKELLEIKYFLFVNIKTTFHYFDLFPNFYFY